MEYAQAATILIVKSKSMLNLPSVVRPSHTILLALVRCAVFCLGIAASVSHATEALAWQALRQGGMVIFRHANAPGVGDPQGMELGDCSTQRNLDEVGRQQASQLGERLRQQKIRVAQVLSSQWCRTLETAKLMALGPVQGEAVFNPFFGDRTSEPAQTAAAQKLLHNWQSKNKGRGSLVVVTHQVNITAMTGLTPASGEGVVLLRKGNLSYVIGFETAAYLTGI